MLGNGADPNAATAASLEKDVVVAEVKEAGSVNEDHGDHVEVAGRNENGIVPQEAQGGEQQGSTVKQDENIKVEESIPEVASEASPKENKPPANVLGKKPAERASSTSATRKVASKAGTKPAGTAVKSDATKKDAKTAAVKKPATTTASRSSTAVTGSSLHRKSHVTADSGAHKKQPVVSAKPSPSKTSATAKTTVAGKAKSPTAESKTERQPAYLRPTASSSATRSVSAARSSVRSPSLSRTAAVPTSSTTRRVSSAPTTKATVQKPPSPSPLRQASSKTVEKKSLSSVGSRGTTTLKSKPPSTEKDTLSKRSDPVKGSSTAQKLEEMQKELDGLKEENARLLALKTELVSLKAENERIPELEKQLAESAQTDPRLEELEKNIASLKEENGRLASLEEELIGLKEKNAVLSSMAEEYADTNAQVPRLTKEIAELREQNARLPDLEREVIELTGENTRLSMSAQTVEDLTQQVSSLKEDNARLAQFEKEIEELKEENRKLVDLQKDVVVVAENIPNPDLQRQMEAMTVRITELESELAAARSENGKLKAEVAAVDINMLVQLKQRVAQLSEENEELLAKKEDLDGTVRDYTELVDLLRGEKDELQSALQQAESTARELEKTVSEDMDELRTKNDELQSQASEAAKTASELARKVSVLESQVSHASDAEAVAESLTEKLADAETKIEELSRQLEEGDKANEELSAKLADKEEKLTQATEAGGNAEEFSAQLAEAQDKVQELTSRLEDAEESSKKIAEQLAEKEDAVKNLAGQLAAEQEEKTQLAKRLAELESTSQSLSSKISELESAAQATADSSKQSQAEMKALTARLSESDSLIQSLTQRLDTSEANAKTLSGGLHVAHEELEHSQELLATKTNELRAALGKLVEAESVIRKLKEKLGERKSRRSSRRSSAEQVVDKEGPTRTRAILAGSDIVNSEDAKDDVEIVQDESSTAAEEEAVHEDSLVVSVTEFSVLEADVEQQKDYVQEDAGDALDETKDHVGGEEPIPQSEDLANLAAEHVDANAEVNVTVEPPQGAKSEVLDAGEEVASEELSPGPTHAHDETVVEELVPEMDNEDLEPVNDDGPIAREELGSAVDDVVAPGIAIEALQVEIGETHASTTSPVPGFEQQLDGLESLLLPPVTDAPDVLTPTWSLEDSLIVLDVPTAVEQSEDKDTHVVGGENDGGDAVDEDMEGAVADEFPTVETGHSPETGDGDGVPHMSSHEADVETLDSQEREADDLVTKLVDVDVDSSAVHAQFPEEAVEDNGDAAQDHGEDDESVAEHLDAPAVMNIDHKLPETDSKLEGHNDDVEHQNTTTSSEEVAKAPTNGNDTEKADLETVEDPTDEPTVQLKQNGVDHHDQEHHDEIAESLYEKNLETVSKTVAWESITEAVEELEIEQKVKELENGGV